jgi:hypothetical protein
LYRGKAAGRNRVEVALNPHDQALLAALNASAARQTDAVE